jgi:hypothetical protein
MGCENRVMQGGELLDSDVNQGTGFARLSNEREEANSGCGKGHSKNARAQTLTLVVVISPLRDLSGVVNADSASESSETSSEHHCMRAGHAR